MAGLHAALSVVYGRRWRLLLLWYVEGAAAFAACWAFFGGGSPRGALTTFAYLVLCGAALTVPAHAVRLGLRRAGASHAARRLALQGVFAFAAAATAGTLATQRGWAAIVCILVLGDALWALELELRERAAAERAQG